MSRLDDGTPIVPRAGFRARLPVRFDFWLFITASFTSNIGFWVRQIAKQWLLYDELAKHDERWLGYDMFALGVPVVLMLPLGGALADRFNRRALMVLTYFANAVVWLTLAWLAGTGRIQLWHVLATSVVTSTIEGLRIAAYQSLYPTLVARNDLPSAIALNSAQFQTSRIIGPALGGVAILLLKPAGCFVVFAVGCAVMMTALAVVRPMRVDDRRTHETVRHKLVEGARYIKSRPDIVTMFTLIVALGALASPTLTMLAPLAKEQLGGGPQSFGELVSAFGLGALAGSLMLTARGKRAPTPWRSYLTALAMAGCLVAIGLSESFDLTLGLLVASGMAWTGTVVRINTAIQHSLPEHVRGRVMAYYMLAIRIGVPFGSLASGWVGESFGIGYAFMAFGVALALAVPAIALTARRRDVTYVESELEHAP